MLARATDPVPSIDQLAEDCRALAGVVPQFAVLHQRNGTPPSWTRDPGFATLTHIVLEQQVSLASARAAFDRLGDALDGSIEPETFLGLDDEELRVVGFSRQKAGYVRGIATDIAGGGLDLDAVGGLDDAAALEALEAVRGVGPWSAGVYLMFALGRVDVWPPGDRALHVSMGHVFEMGQPPASEKAAEMAQAWRPWRSAAARLLWHEYLGGPDAVPSERDGVGI